MTAPDPRVGEIEARHGTKPCSRHDNCSRSDVAYLLAELRKAHEALARMEALGEHLEASELNDNEFMRGRGSGFRIAGVRIKQTLRAAVAAANGDGHG